MSIETPAAPSQRQSGDGHSSIENTPQQFASMPYGFNPFFPNVGYSIVPTILPQHPGFLNANYGLFNPYFNAQPNRLEQGPSQAGALEAPPVDPLGPNTPVRSLMHQPKLQPSGFPAVQTLTPAGDHLEGTASRSPPNLYQPKHDPVAPKAHGTVDPQAEADPHPRYKTQIEKSEAVNLPIEQFRGRTQQPYDAETRPGSENSVLARKQALSLAKGEEKAKEASRSALYQLEETYQIRHQLLNKEFWHIDVPTHILATIPGLNLETKTLGQVHAHINSLGSYPNVLAKIDTRFCDYIITHQEHLSKVPPPEPVPQKKLEIIPHHYQWVPGPSSTCFLPDFIINETNGWQLGDSLMIKELMRSEYDVNRALRMFSMYKRGAVGEFEMELCAYEIFMRFHQLERHKLSKIRHCTKPAGASSTDPIVIESDRESADSDGTPCDSQALASRDSRDRAPTPATPTTLPSARIPLPVMPLESPIQTPLYPPPSETAKESYLTAPRGRPDANSPSRKRPFCQSILPVPKALRRAPIVLQEPFSATEDYAILFRMERLKESATSVRELLSSRGCSYSTYTVSTRFRALQSANKAAWARKNPGHEYPLDGFRH